MSLARLANVKAVGPDGSSGYFLFVIRSILYYPRSEHSLAGFLQVHD